MLIVAVITITAFVFLYNTTQLDELASIRNPTIYGKSLNPVDIDRQVKNYQLTRALGQFDLLEKLGGTAPDVNVAVTEFVFNLLILQHQANELGVQPTIDQVADRIKDLPIFQTEGRFDPSKYGAFVTEQLAPRGFTERQLEEVMRDALRLEIISRIVEAPAAIGVGDAESRERIFQPVNAVYVKFTPKAEADKVTISEDEIAAFLKNNQQAFQSPETRAVRYVAFELPKGSKLDGKEKVEALQKLANEASVLVDSITVGGMVFDEAAKKAGGKIRSLPAFDRSGVVAKPQGDGLPSAQDMESLAGTAFILGTEGQTSDVIQIGDGFYVLELAEVNPSRSLTLEEARGQIETQLRADKAQQLFIAASASTYKALTTAVTAGKSLEEVAKTQGLEVGKLDSLVPAGDATTPEQQALAAATLLLREGEISQLEQAPWGAFAIQLQKRLPYDKSLYARQEEQMKERLLRYKRDLLFAEWLRVNREAARITMPGGEQG